MKYSVYQEALFDAIQEMCCNIMVRALAGSGKSTTIEHAIARIPQSKRVLVLAFNKHIADSMRARLPSHVEVSTCNSFGFKCLRGQVGKLNANKVRNLLLYRVLGLDNLSGKEKATAYQLVKPVTQLVGLLRAHAVGDISMWQELVEKYAVEVPEVPDFQAILNETWNLTVGDSRVIDFDDQIYIPVMRKLIVPSYDFVFIDEAQDLNYCQMLFVMQAGARGRIIAVGDEHQAIYGFRGADTDAIKTFEKMLGGVTLPLSICYRCSKSVIKEAQVVVPDIECSETAPEGAVLRIPESKLAESLVEDDWVLCRTTAPLVSMCMKMIRKGHKAVVKGRDIGEQLAQFVNQMGPPTTPTEGFMTLLESYLEKETVRLKKANRDEELISVEDRVETIRCLLEDTGTLADVLERIATIFSDDRAAIMFCTVHRSKGLESKRIFILRPDLLPHPKAKLAWQQIQEENLKYVAITRAKETLTWVIQDKDYKDEKPHIGAGTSNSDNAPVGDQKQKQDDRGAEPAHSDSGISPAGTDSCGDSGTNSGVGLDGCAGAGPVEVPGQDRQERKRDSSGNSGGVNNVLDESGVSISPDHSSDGGPDVLAGQGDSVLPTLKQCAVCGLDKPDCTMEADLVYRCKHCRDELAKMLTDVRNSDAVKFEEAGSTLTPEMQEVLRKYGYLGDK